MDNLALLLDKASFIRNREVPLTKNWVNLAEYFEVCEEVKLRCQQSSPNSPAKNLFEFLRTISISVKKVTDCLREIGRTDLANMMETLCLPGRSVIGFIAVESLRVPINISIVFVNCKLVL